MYGRNSSLVFNGLAQEKKYFPNFQVFEVRIVITSKFEAYLPSTQSSYPDIDEHVGLSVTRRGKPFMKVASLALSRMARSLSILRVHRELNVNFSDSCGSRRTANALKHSSLETQFNFGESGKPSRKSCRYA